MAVTTAVLASALIQSFEGLRLTAYRDAGGRLTVGFGHTGKVDGADIVAGMTITEAKALELFEEDARPVIDMVKDRPILEAAALVSFGYNCGVGALGRLLRGEFKITEYGTRSGGVRLAGLVARRKVENVLIELSRQLFP